MAWKQVHQGYLPLLDPYNGLGLPLAFNWQLAPFGFRRWLNICFPYSSPLTLASSLHSVTAGTGAYVLCRILRLNVLACVLAGTVFELSGPLTAWLGYPPAVISWIGWLFAACILIIRGHRRALSVAFFAVGLAMAIYAGQPEVLTFLILSVVVFALILLAMRARECRSIRSLKRPTGDFLIAGVSGRRSGHHFFCPDYRPSQRVCGEAYTTTRQFRFTA